MILATTHTLGAWGAACCGGAQGSSLVITGDEVMRLRFAQGVLQVYGRSIDFGQAVFAGHVSRQWQGSIAAVSVLSEHWQVGVDGGWSGSAQSSGRMALRDTFTAATYTLRRNYLYSSWAPEMFLNAGVQWPTGVSFYRDQNRATDDSLYKFKVSCLATRSHRSWDWSVSMHYAKSLPREFDDLRFRKGDSLSMDFQAGITPKLAPDFHVSVTQTAQYRTPNQVEILNQNAQQKSLSMWGFPISLSVAYAWNSVWSSSIFYTNQRIFSSQNAEVSDTLGVQLVFRQW